MASLATMLIRHLTATGAAVLLAAGLTTAAQTSFAGTWVMDPERSNGLPPGLELTMTVRQTGDRLETETVVKGPEGERKIPDVYVVDGRETDFKPPIGGEGSGTGKRTSTWRDDKRGFDVTERAVVRLEGEEATLSVTRKWTLAPDGQSLTIEMTMNGPQGEMKTTRLFTRQT